MPGIEGAQIHVGNLAWPPWKSDTTGCILAGERAEVDKILDSKEAMQDIIDIIKADATGKITVEINNSKLWIDSLYRKTGVIE